MQAEEILQLIRSTLNESGPSTPASFSSTPVLLSPASVIQSSTLPVSAQLGLASALAPAQQEPPPAPVFTYEALKNNPLGPKIPYVIHLTSRHDFGPVYSHRYFVCPDDLSHDWIEVSLVQWFAQGEPFKMKAEKWDLKCTKDCRFFRLTLRPNLWLRGCYTVPTPAKQHVHYPPATEETGVVERRYALPVPYPAVIEEAGVVDRRSALPVPVPVSSVQQVSYSVFGGRVEGGLENDEK